MVTISGQVVLVSGQPVLVSGQPVLVSGHPVLVSGQPVLVSGQPVLVSGQPVLVSGQVVSVSGQTVLISGQFSGQPMSISLSGTNVAIDTVNFALIQEDVIHRKIHQGLQWSVQEHHSSPPDGVVRYQICTSGLTNPIHIGWKIGGMPGTTITFLRVDNTFSSLPHPGFTGIPLSLQNFNLFLSGSVFTSVTFYTSVFTSSQSQTTLFSEIIVSGNKGQGFSTLDSYPIHPNEWVLFPGKSYQWLIEERLGPGITAPVDFYASWYESGA